MPILPPESHDSDLNDADNARYWRLIENAKRLLVAQLLKLGLPVKSKVDE